MSNLPFTLPTCTNPATVRLEVYSPANGILHGSLDAVVYACDQHAIEVAAAIEAAGLTAYRYSAPGIDIDRTCGYAHVFPTGQLAVKHPAWCDRKTCERRRAHCSPVIHVDTNRPEATVLDVALIQEWHPAAEPMVSLTAINGVQADQLLMSLDQARVLTYKVQRLVTSALGGQR